MGYSSILVGDFVLAELETFALFDMVGLKVAIFDVIFSCGFHPAVYFAFHVFFLWSAVFAMCEGTN